MEKVLERQADDLNEPLTFRLLPHGSQRGGPLLLDNRGNSYNKNADKSMKKLVFKCSRRTKEKCLAKVYFNKGEYVPGDQPHTHPGQPGRAKRLEIMSTIKEQAKAEVFTPAAAIVEDVLGKTFGDNVPPGAIPKIQTAVRAANLYRQKKRPSQPKDLNFKLDESHLPDDFLQEDIRVGEARHLVLTTPTQQQLLANAKFLHMESIYCKLRPFSHLFSIDTFVNEGDGVKQVPLVCVMMSRCQIEDYIEVFQVIELMVPHLSLTNVMADYDAGLWAAVWEIFPDVKIRGCFSQWTQAIFHQVKNLGLGPAYLERGSVHTFVRQLLALPFLPAPDIPEVLAMMEQRATESLHPLTEYIRSTWVESEQFPYDTWSVYQQSVIINTDVKKWSHNLDTRIETFTNLYHLVQMLYEVAGTVSLQAQHLSIDELSSIKKENANIQNTLQGLWKKHSENAITSAYFLRACSRLINIDCEIPLKTESSTRKKTQETEDDSSVIMETQEIKTESYVYMDTAETENESYVYTSAEETLNEHLYASPPETENDIVIYTTTQDTENDSSTELPSTSTEPSTSSSPE